MLFDTHAHYDDNRFNDDRDPLLTSMRDNGVELILNPGCDFETSEKAVSYANKYDFMYAAVGYHPENLDEGVNLEGIKNLALNNEKVRAIGEIGLDYYWEKDEQKRKYQQEIFHSQMQLARELKLPVIIHDREAHKDCLDICKQYPDVTGVFHCYSSSTEMALDLVKMGYYISFTGVVTYKNARKSLEVIEKVPLDRIVIETDAPYLSPEPFRGRRNSSLFVHRVAEQIAEVRGLSVEEVAKITLENGKALFNINSQSNG